MTDALSHLKRASIQRTADAKGRYQRWLAKHGSRIDGQHPDVAAEIRSLVASRFHDGAEASGLTDQDMRECMMRVASRLRLKRWGPCDPDEAGQQLRAIVGEIGGETPQQRAA